MKTTVEVRDDVPACTLDVSTVEDQKADRETPLPPTCVTTVRDIANTIADPEKSYTSKFDTTTENSLDDKTLPVVVNGNMENAFTKLGAHHHGSLFVSPPITENMVTLSKMNVLSSLYVDSSSPNRSTPCAHSPHSDVSCESPVLHVVPNKAVSTGSARTSHAGRLSPCVTTMKATHGDTTTASVSTAKCVTLSNTSTVDATEKTSPYGQREKKVNESERSSFAVDSSSTFTAANSIVNTNRASSDSKKSTPLPRLPSPSVDSTTAIVQPVPKTDHRPRSPAPQWPMKSSPGAFSAPTGVCNPVHCTAPTGSPVRASEPPLHQATSYLGEKFPLSDVKASEFLIGADSSEHEARLAAAAATARMMSLPALLPPTLSPWNYLDMATKYGFPAREACPPSELLPPLPLLGALPGYRFGASSCCNSPYNSHLSCETALFQRPLCYTCQPFAAVKTFHEYLAALPHASTAPPAPVSSCNMFCSSPAGIVAHPPPPPSAIFNAFHPDILLRKDLLTTTPVVSPFMSAEPSPHISGSPAVITPVPRLAKRKSEPVRDHVTSKGKRKCMRTIDEYPLDLSLRN